HDGRRRDPIGEGEHATEHPHRRNPPPDLTAMRSMLVTYRAAMPRIGRVLTAAGLAAGAAAAWRWLGPDRVAVDGESMSPALRPGDRLLLLRGRVRRGDVVAFRHPRLPGITAVKRVAGLP